MHMHMHVCTQIHAQHTSNVPAVWQCPCGSSIAEGTTQLPGAHTPPK